MAKSMQSYSLGKELIKRIRINFNTNHHHARHKGSNMSVHVLLNLLNELGRQQ